MDKTMNIGLGTQVSYRGVVFTATKELATSFGRRYVLEASAPRIELSTGPRYRMTEGAELAVYEDGTIALSRSGDYIATGAHGLVVL